MARENPSWGYTRLRGALQNLGLDPGRSTLQRIPKEHGIEPAPLRGKAMSWKTFLKAHWGAIAAADFFSVEVLTRGHRGAARAGESFAAYNLAAIFRDRREFARERYWLKRAATLGDETAPLVLAEIELASRRSDHAEAALRYLRTRTKSSNESVRREAQEIISYFQRTGQRRWAPQ